MAWPLSDDMKKMSPPRSWIVAPALLAVSCTQSQVSIGLDDPTDAGGSGPADAQVAADVGTSGDAAVPPGVDLVLLPSPGVCPVSVQYEVPRFEVAFENRGAQASAAVIVRLIACPGACATGSEVTLFEGAILQGLAPGEERSFVEPMPALPASPVGPWRMYFVVDPDGSIAESDETNNRSNTFMVHNGLRAQPTAQDFGAVCVGGGAQSTVTLQNVGTEAITLSAAWDVSPSTEIVFQMASTPLTLAPGASVVASTSYTPIDIGPDRHMKVIEWDLSVCPLIFLSSGEGIFGPVQTETFQQWSQPVIDTLVVIDNSGSMVDEVANLRANLPTLHAGLVADGIDFHLGVTNMDLDVGGAQGRLLGQPAYLTQATANGAALWSAHIEVGTTGSGLDQGLEASRLALSPPLSTGDNAGFLRPDADLLVLYVSDEDDASMGPVSALQSFLLGLTPDPRVNAIVTTPGSNCGPTAQRYLDLVAGTGGRAVDICGSDWSYALADVARDGLGLRRAFALAAAAGVGHGDLEVSVNGNTLPPTAYRYDPSTGTLTFEPPATPGAGTIITVTYPSACP